MSKGFAARVGDGVEGWDKLRDSRSKFAGGENVEGTGEDFVGSIT